MCCICNTQFHLDQLFKDIAGNFNTAFTLFTQDQSDASDSDSDSSDDDPSDESTQVSISDTSANVESPVCI